ncbi:MAG: peptidylprolyl isomerase [Patescibacteria group bacterium]
MKILIAVGIILVLIVAGYLLFTMNNDSVAVVETSQGTFEIELYQNDAPNTVANFIKLTNQNFYDNLIFHRVVKGFVIQGGDPNSNGTGGPGYSFADELDPNTKSYQEGYVKGAVAMANSGPNTNGSQWFVTLADLPQLPKNYSIFGRVIKGQDAVDAIGLVAVDNTDKPVSSVVIKKITIR